MGEESLNIVIRAQDEASGTIASLETRWNAMAAAVANSEGKVARTRAELDAATEAQQNLGAATEESGNMFQAFGDKADSMLTRLAVKATVIGAIIGGFVYLKDAITEAEKSNKAYTDQFEKSTDSIEKQKIALGDDFIPALMLLKRTWADVTGATEDGTHKLGPFAEGITDVAKAISVLIVRFKEVGQLDGEVVNLIISAWTDASDFLSQEFGNIGRAFEDLVHGNFKKAGQDLVMINAGTFAQTKSSWDDIVKTNQDAQTEIDKIWSFKNPASLSDEQTKKTKDHTKEIADAMQSLQDVINTTTGNMTKDNKTFIDESVNDYENFTQKMSDLNTQLETLEADHQAKLKDIRDGGTDKEVSAYEKYQDRLKKLPEEIEKATYAVGKATDKGSTAIDFAAARQKLQDLLDEKDMAEKAIAAHPELAAAAAKDKNTDAITKAEEAAQKKIEAEDKAYKKSKSVIEQHMVDEQTLYDNQKDALVKKVEETYDKLAEAVIKGLEKLARIKGITPGEISAVQSATAGALGGIQSSEASSLAAIKNPTGASASAPITINVLSGATVHAATPQGVSDLARVVQQGVASTMQNMRYGLATK